MNVNNRRLNQKKINYPVDYHLKLIMDNNIPKEEHIKNISEKLKGLQIRFSHFSSKLSSKANYISLSVRVYILSEHQFKVLYPALKEVEGLITAI